MTLCNLLNQSLHSFTSIVNSFTGIPELFTRIPQFVNRYLCHCFLREKLVNKVKDTDIQIEGYR